MPERVDKTSDARQAYDPGRRRETWQDAAGPPKPCEAARPSGRDTDDRHTRPQEIPVEHPARANLSKPTPLIQEKP